MSEVNWPPGLSVHSLFSVVQCGIHHDLLIGFNPTMCDCELGRIVPVIGGPMLYIYSAKTLRAMLVDARQALKNVEDNEALNVQDMITAIIHELSTRKD